MIKIEHNNKKNLVCKFPENHLLVQAHRSPIEIAPQKWQSQNSSLSKQGLPILYTQEVLHNH